jgi:ABC-type transport system involved in cytochrome bd biosynthesis fused ATPase/permease subunit
VAVMADVHRSCADRTLVVVQHRPEGLDSVGRVVHVGARH